MGNRPAIAYDIVEEDDGGTFFRPRRLQVVGIRSAVDLLAQSE